jgi:hypothetical protein
MAPKMPADATFVVEPDLDLTGCYARLLRDRVQTGGEILSESSIAPAVRA